MSDKAIIGRTIRKELKTHGITGTVKARKSGSSINVNLENATKAQAEHIRDFVDQFRGSDFCGMQDLKTYRDNPLNLPQCDYINVQNDYTGELAQRAWTFIRNKLTGCEEAPADYNEASYWMHPQTRQYAGALVREVLHGAWGGFEW